MHFINDQHLYFKLPKGKCYAVARGMSLLFANSSFFIHFSFPMSASLCLPPLGRWMSVQSQLSVQSWAVGNQNPVCLISGWLLAMLSLMSQSVQGFVKFNYSWVTCSSFIPPPQFCFLFSLHLILLLVTIISESLVGLLSRLHFFLCDSRFRQ